jgi:hypothetical protein
MKGINKTLSKELDKSPIFRKHAFGLDISKFLDLKPDNYETRQNLALDIAENILDPHGKGDLPSLAIKLAKLERNLKDIQPYQRDHVCHSLLTFLLGYFIILKLNLQRKYHDFLFQWKLVALLHDVGYSLEIVDRLSNNFFKMYEQEILGTWNNFEATQVKRLVNYLKLYTIEENQRRNTLDLITKRLESWGISIDAGKIFENMLNSKKFDEKKKEQIME